MQIDLKHDISDRMYNLTITEIRRLNERIEYVIQEFTKNMKTLIDKIDNIKK